MSQVADTERRGLLSESAVVRRVQSIWTGFIDFALRDNVLEVAVGLMIASSFTGVVNTLVSEVLLPLISLIPGFNQGNLSEKFLVLRSGAHRQKYNTLQQAHDDGAATLAYGLLIDRIILFLGLGLVLYGIASFYGLVTNDSIISHTTKCAYCRKTVSVKAKRCFMCTSWLDGREDKETSALPAA